MTQELRTIDDTNDMALAVLDENRNKIMARDGSKVFPITPVIRKKLETLKETWIGDLRTQMGFIKEEKYALFQKSKAKDIERINKQVIKENKRIEKTVITLMLKKRKKDDKIHNLKIVSDKMYPLEAKKFFKPIQEFSEKYDSYITEQMSYDFVLKGYSRSGEEEEEPSEDNTKIVRDYQEYMQRQKDKKAFYLTFDSEKYKREVINKEFNERFGIPFKKAQDRINELEQQFGEAVLFGDMEVAKQVYYNLRRADGFLEQLREINFE